MVDARPSHPNRGPDITPADAFAAGDGIILLDVRDPEEWAGGHAAGARHVPLGDLEASTFDLSVPIIAICRSGNRSGRAANVLAAAGFDVRNMVGGMTSWQQDGLPVVRDDGTPGTI